MTPSMRELIDALVKDQLGYLNGQPYREISQAVSDLVREAVRRAALATAQQRVTYVDNYDMREIVRAVMGDEQP